MPQTVSSYSSRAMLCGVARSAKRHQVLFRIIAGLAAEFLVMDFKTPPGAAQLTSPAITP
jgi:hypothetical protein